MNGLLCRLVGLVLRYDQDDDDEEVHCCLHIENEIIGPQGPSDTLQHNIISSLPPSSVSLHTHSETDTMNRC